MQDLPHWIPLAVSALNFATALVGWAAGRRRRSRPRRSTKPAAKRQCRR
ncbi:hypothetical protein [Nonomuraea rhodomycinica]|uniref:Uncharacterized protein n=1 Tax=Nonomuraea rhodomycinica TaxID=1712872 RepID=A0A7Y6IKT5_9ACTN|nr:hypothetical protein [Nonomuraea rhodomycinica]NUW39578.1 hypothetical protein [Nonomuraea rhodomycinica]